MCIRDSSFNGAGHILHRLHAQHIPAHQDIAVGKLHRSRSMQARQQIVQCDDGAGEIQARLKFHILLELHTPAVVIFMSFVKRLFQSLRCV